VRERRRGMSTRQGGWRAACGSRVGSEGFLLVRRFCGRRQFDCTSSELAGVPVWRIGGHEKRPPPLEDHGGCDCLALVPVKDEGHGGDGGDVLERRAAERRIKGSGKDRGACPEAVWSGQTDEAGEEVRQDHRAVFWTMEKGTAEGAAGGIRHVRGAIFQRRSEAVTTKKIGKKSDRVGWLTVVCVVFLCCHTCYSCHALWSPARERRRVGGVCEDAVAERSKKRMGGTSGRTAMFEE